MTISDAAIAEVTRAHESVKEATLCRQEAIRAASQAGVPLREISAAVGGELSHEAIRTIVGPRSGVAFVWNDQTYRVSEPQTRALIYKADGHGRNAFPGDVGLLAAGTRWLPTAADLAISMRRVHSGLDAQPIKLDRQHAFALFQILRLTYMDALSPLAELRMALHHHFGSPAPVGRRRQLPKQLPGRPRR